MGSRKFAPSSFTDAVAMRALERMGKLIHQGNGDGGRAGGSWVHPHPSCKLILFGKTQYGQHHVCNRTYTQPCTTLTYGVNNEYSFELEVREKMGCRVFALDPTVNHKAELAPGVHFLKWAAPSPKGATHVATYAETQGWFVMPPPQLARLVARGQRIPILKMDCEGCEYKIFDDVMRHDPRFFLRVDQVALEVHLSKTIGLATRENALSYGKLLALLHRSGHRLQHSFVLHCSRPDKPPETSGVRQELWDTGYYKGPAASNRNFGDGHCHNYLFARVTSATM